MQQRTSRGTKPSRRPSDLTLPLHRLAFQDPRVAGRPSCSGAVFLPTIKGVVVSCRNYGPTSRPCSCVPGSSKARLTNEHGIERAVPARGKVELAQPDVDVLSLRPLGQLVARPMRPSHQRSRVAKG